MERYLIEVISFQALFLVTYWLLFRKNTFFKTHRVYLLAVPFISLLLPFIKITAFQTVVPEAGLASVFLPDVMINSQGVGAEAISNSTSAIQWDSLWIYYAGVLVSLTVFSIKMFKLRSFLKFRKASERLIEIPESTEAFTFFNYIFIGEEIDTLSRKHVIAHERIHVKQKHTWDLLAFEILRVVMWFNPLVYLYQKEITRVHEYLADAGALGKTTKQDYYEKLLNTAFGTSNLSFTNTFFNHSSIKNRIVMLQKSKSTKTELLKYFLIIPMVLGMLFYVSCSEEENDRPQSDTEVMDQIVVLSEAIMRKGNLTDEEVLALKFLSTEAKEGDKIYLSVDEYLEEQRGKNEQTVDFVEIEGPEGDGYSTFSNVENPPLFKGCSDQGTKEETQECFRKKLNEYIASEFNTSIADDTSLSGTQKVFVKFVIDTDGTIIDVKVRAANEIVANEASRVISNIPPMDRSASNNGVPVKVAYTQPIIFKIEE